MAITINGTTKTPSEAPAKEAKAPGGVSFLRRGKESRDAVAEAEARAEAAANGAWRFRIGPKQLGEDFRITFLDGDLGDDGLLDHGGSWEEHTVQHAGKWDNYVCVEHGAGSDPCPICNGGDNPSMVFVLSVIDNTEYQRQDGTTTKDRRKLYVFKRTTLKTLDKLAKKRGGLTGCVFDVTRVGQKSPNVGDMFDFVEKLSPDELAEKYGSDDEGNPKWAPFKYAEVIKYRTAEELINMGLGVPVETIGGSAPTESLNAEL